MNIRYASSAFFAIAAIILFFFALVSFSGHPPEFIVVISESLDWIFGERYSPLSSMLIFVLCAFFSTLLSLYLLFRARG